MGESGEVRRETLGHETTQIKTGSYFCRFFSISPNVTTCTFASKVAQLKRVQRRNHSCLRLFCLQSPQSHHQHHHHHFRHYFTQLSIGTVTSRFESTLLPLTSLIKLALYTLILFSHIHSYRRRYI